MDAKIPDDVLETAGICQNCFIKFNEYDEFQTRANQIQLELMGMYQHGASAFIDIKPAVKEEPEITEVVYAYDDVEIEAEETYQEVAEVRPSPKKTATIKHFRPPASESITKYRKTPSFSKVDKDAGYIVCMIDGVKHYQCEFCGKQDFVSRSRLKTHKQIHVEERNFMCQVWKDEKFHSTLQN